MISTLMQQESLLLIDGPAGKLELVVANEEGEEEGNVAWGIVCHPHPLHGGTMHNKVVTTLVKTFQQLGLNTIRFNFRGVGQSEGHYDDGRGELEDLLAVVSWVEKEWKQKKIWLGGFSFGSYIAAKAATQLPEVKKLVTIAPPVQHFPMRTLPPILCPWILVQGEKDDVVPPQDVFEWAESRNPKPVVLHFPHAGHFFHGQLGELRTRLEEVLQRS